MNEPMIIFGDWHGNVSWALYAITKVQHVSRNMYHLGDFGLWTFQPNNPSSKSYQYLKTVNSVLAVSDANLNIVLGNHEDYTMLSYGTQQEDGTVIFPNFPHLIFWPRAYYTTDPGTGLTIAALGGAGSIDKVFKEKNLSWWEEEEILPSDVEKFKKLVPKGNVDVFLSHDAPANVPYLKTIQPPSYATVDVLHYCEKQRELLLDAFNWAAPKYAFHGHWHLSEIAEIENTTHDNVPYRTTIVALDMDEQQKNVAVLTHDGVIDLPKMF